MPRATSPHTSPRVQVADRVTPPEGEQEPLNRAWPAVPESVAAARSAVAQYASVRGASADVLDAIRVAVSEAFTNAVLHAYPNADQVGTVDVTAEQTDGVLHIAVADGGLVNAGACWTVSVNDCVAVPFSFAEVNDSL